MVRSGRSGVDGVAAPDRVIGRCNRAIGNGEAAGAPGGTMEWHFAGRETRDIAPLRDEVVAYFRRHGEADADYDGLALVVSELLSNVWRHTTSGGWLEA